MGSSDTQTTTSSADSLLNNSPYLSAGVTAATAVIILVVAVLSTLSYIDIKKSTVSSNYKNMSLALVIISWIAFIIALVSSVGGFMVKKKNDKVDYINKGVYTGYSAGLVVTLLLLLVMSILSFVLYFTTKAKYSLYIGILSVVAFIVALASGLIATSRTIKNAVASMSNPSAEVNPSESAK